MSNWIVYILRCSGGSFYTGVTTDLKERLLKHNAGKGGSYTRSRRPVRLLYQEPRTDRASAQKREAQIKSWSRAQKEEFLRAPRKP